MASTPLLPVIIISDYTRTPALSLAYSTFGKTRKGNNNIIYFAPTYKHIKSLLTLPPCRHKTPNLFWPCDECAENFAHNFWHGAKLLLDYFADFFSQDSAVMHSVWFHLFDVWQESAHWLPFTAQDTEQPVFKKRVHPQVEAFFRSAREKAKTFDKAFQETLTLIDKVIWGRKARNGIYSKQDPMLFNPRGEASTPLRIYDTGPWISGLKPWMQFLSSGGPGVFPPLPLPPLESGAAKPSPGEIFIAKRYIPYGAIALLKTHVERARAMADMHYSFVDKDNRNDYLDVFDRYSPVFPTPQKHTHSFVSSMITTPSEGKVVSPRKITYTLGNGAPPIQRLATGEYADVELQCLVPDWNLVDEAVALCKGWKAYVAAGETEADSESGEDDEDDWLCDMWTVIETRDGGEQKRGREERDVLVLGEMFENWTSIGECLNLKQ